MNALPPSFAPTRDSRTRDGENEAVHRMEVAWFALHRAGEAVAGLAGDIAQDSPPGVGDFPARIYQVGGWRLRQAQQGITDLTAIMESGLAALLCLRERGAETSAAAQALWQEFRSARDALVELGRPLARLC